ncbi:uncharacterized protein FIBRA_08047 [Fibroporia radiculosa]|uniref:Protein kinase domain-containing protein n=1 Tax=Fibroporia radiculosa TaxID=599839 RepID=J4GGA7_9APHY|nr:uncharacterized protein FIBRA_08047 [Fibroporia radiculosa]CCM05813.1 predicted protein [Fibroporia radiculosa]
MSFKTPTGKTTSRLSSDSTTTLINSPALPLVDVVDSDGDAKAPKPSFIHGARPRGHSTSTIRPEPSESALPMSRVTSNPLPQSGLSSLAASFTAEARPATRSRASSRVAEAAINVLGIAGDVTHETLLVSSELLKFAPIPGLALAAKLLLEIWDSLQQVDVNRVTCMRLTERCATILYSVREDVAEAGDEVGDELLHPIERLVETFTQVHLFLQTQNHRPFLKRYLRRDEIQRSIQMCDNSLTDALSMFSFGIQIRILKQVLKAEEQRQTDTAALLERLVQNTPPHQASPLNALLLTGTEPDATPVTSVDQLMGATPEQIRSTLRTINARQTELDLVQDTAELRQLMRAALSTNNDGEMIRVLQVGRDEMPEAIKALQRALENELERDSIVAVEQEETVVASVSAASTSVETGKDGSGLSRSKTVASVESHKTTHSVASRRPRDTLDREFIETGIDALRRLSSVEVPLPSWTITRYEVDREEKIGIGFFSDVYKGTWREHTVAIKVLAETTPRQLFIHEATIWKELQHPNVLELLGASSASSDPPWFFVSPYYKNGSMVTYLKGLPSLDSVDPLKMVHEVAKGMAYLHGKGVLHSDLKGTNILVDDRGHCVISDFGQSEMKSEVYRMSGTPLPHGTLRWQAPELMAGESKMTQQMDVYAFAMCCIEVITKGALPWQLADDDAVRHFVLKENMRPQIPLIPRKWIPQLAEIINACWDRHPAARPSFAKVVKDLEQLRLRFDSNMRDSPLQKLPQELDDHISSRKSPDMHPVNLPFLPPDTDVTIVDEPSLSSDNSYETAQGDISSPPSYEHVHGHEPEASDPFSQFTYGTTRSSSRSSSMCEDTPDSRSDAGVMLDPPGYQSPPPADARDAQIRNERRYRMLLQHEFHPSLTLPLWTPEHVPLGAVGYLSKPDGRFVILFNAFKPFETSNGVAANMASLEGFGRISTGSQRQDKRSVTQRGMDMLQSWINSKSSPSSNVSRRYSSPLRAGHKAAHLFTESTVYRYVEDLASPKRWFKANVDMILELYGKQHQLARDDLYLVIGTLEAQDYALHVSHNHPDEQLNFNVHAAARAGQPWGHFTTTTDLASSLIGGPVYSDEPATDASYAEKVSTVGRGGKWDSVLIARLRFKTDSSEPTSL